MTTQDGRTLAPLRIPEFRRLWVAIMAFNIGHLVLVVASSWRVLELTSSPLWVSAMIGAPTVPLLLLSLPAGAAADLFDRRKLLVGSSAVMMLSAAGMAATTALGVASPVVLVMLGLLLGVGVAFFNPAWQAIVPSLVPQPLIPGAIALNSASGGVATALGPALGGLLVATAGPALSFWVATAGYGIILLTALFGRGPGWDTESDSIPTAIATGIRYLRFSDGYLTLLLLGSAFGFASAALRAMLPNLTSEALGGDSALYGVLLGAFGAGAMVGGLTRRRGSRLLGDHMIPISIIVFGGAGILVGLAPQVPVALIGITVSGLLWTWILATMNSIFQMLTPDWVRGRTMAAFVLAVFGFLPLGALAAGALGDVIGAARSLSVFSAGVVLVGLTAFRMNVPVLETISPPVLPSTKRSERSSSRTRAKPVMVMTTWTLASQEEADAFVGVLSDLRRVRLTTGAYRWNAYHDVGNPLRISETYLVHSWEHHLQADERLDTRGIAVIQRAAGFGVAGTHVTTHLVELDVTYAGAEPGVVDEA